MCHNCGTLHVRTCKGRSQISRTAESIALKLRTAMKHIHAVPQIQDSTSHQLACRPKRRFTGFAVTNIGVGFRKVSQIE